MVYSSTIEYVDIVDEQDKVIRVVSRAEMRKNNLLHRVSTIFVFNKKHELLIQKRTLTKDIHHGLWDASAGETVVSGESYDTAAHRGLHEELGLTNSVLKPLFKFLYQGKDTSGWYQVYTTTYEGPFDPQQEEIDELKFVSVDQLQHEIDIPCYSPSFQALFHEYVRRFRI